MSLRFWIVVLAVWAALVAVPDSGLAAGAGVPRGGQNLHEAWVLGADTVWAWTQDETGPTGGGGAQGIELTTDGGVSWSDVTPPGLAVQGGKHWLNGLFALNANDAWVTYGGLGSEAPQRIIETTDGGRNWRVLSRKPPSCQLQFVSVKDGWCAAIGAAAGSETVTLYRTTDGARSWQVVSRTGLYSTSSKPGSLPFAGDKNIEFGSARIGWAVFGTPGGVAPLFETENGGRTWEPRTVASPPPHLGPPPRDGYGGIFAGRPVISGRFGAVGYNIDQRHGARTIVYRTTNGGVTWRPVVPPGPGEPWLVDAVTGRRWRLVYGNRILETENAGQTWRTVRANHTFPPLFYSFSSPTPPVVLFAPNNIGWVVQQDTETSLTTLWRTVDGGSRWYHVRVPGI